MKDKSIYLVHALKVANSVMSNTMRHLALSISDDKKIKIPRLRLGMTKKNDFLSRNYLLSFAILIFLFFSIPATKCSGASKLDIGADYRLRGIQYGNPTYASEQPLGSGVTLDHKYYSHRARIYLKAKLEPEIEIGSVIQAIGVAGSTAPLLNRYPNEIFQPFIENAYIQANNIQGWPISATLGRQPYTWGTGLILADDGLGFDGIRLDIGPYWGGLKNHFFTAKTNDRLTGETDTDIYLAGLSFKWGIHDIKFGWMMEDDRTGTPYSYLSATAPATTDKIKRQFFDLQVGGQLEKGAFYSAEYAMQKGKAQIPGKEVTLSGSALTFEGGFDFIHPRYKRMILAFVFMQGSGDEFVSKDEDEAFKPSFGHKYDGLERAGKGEFFAATPYSFYNEDKLMMVTKDTKGNIVQQFPYKNLFSGLRTFGFRGSVNPWTPFVAGLEFYIHTARETPNLGNGAPTTINDNELGRELVITGSYVYANRIHFAIRWGKFFPAVNLNDIGSSRITFETSARF